jgi:large subunit ribosomal protein L25
MTKSVQLACQTRSIVGNKVKILKRSGITPAVVYAKFMESTPIQINTGEFLKVYKESGRTGVIELTIDGKKVSCLVHDLNVHPHKRTLRHVDFLAVDLKVKVIADVPITITGTAPAVKEFGGVLNIAKDTVEIEALPNEMPSEISVDVSVLTNLDSAIHISDLKPTAKYAFADDMAELVVNIVSQSVEEEVDTTPMMTEAAATPETK